MSEEAEAYWRWNAEQEVDRARADLMAASNHCASLSDQLGAQEELISELLEALKSALTLPRPWMPGASVSVKEWESAFERIEAAISKAEGR